ncbi:16S rRNA (guanine(966)-N(2))-methyltransferase RsmD [Ferrovibrio sp.]|uniref:16S rRNA (guanine(966)-N(2))-methyltransferase RsmD n=1 Tax=Ferrovibrio sp. TaxID=1917215 RepID=UPI001B7AD552|nr:16S rRNA (guanine(966)-N(2))-methyltransferase RsmD [Ferrovibrio sp.]MBP7065057.1 16S rRNA (guanine(966)-N(2))-methyltransferase RsmD [Ferrovibrio sp.]
MRIVGGSHRGRALHAPPEQTTRPTTDRVRESLFNILLHSPRMPGDDGRPLLEGGIVLDAFAGSGALSFEALSRGARHAHLFEIDAAARRCILRNAAELGLAERITLRATDASRPGRCAADMAADIVLLDPPYRSGLAVPVLQALEREGWLKPQALAIIESDARGSLALPPGFELVDERRQGPARLSFLRRGD